MYLSYRLNSAYSKEKILEMYFNAFSFGYNANGVEEASRTYFGKSAKDAGIEIQVSRLARGIPVGVDLEYADQITLSHALEGRRILS